MKKFSLLLTLILFSCKSLITAPETVPLESSKQEKVIAETHQQFESRDLETQKINQKKIQIALFLPFSGKNKDLGWSLFNTATLSLFENDENHNIELVLVDCKDSPQENIKAFKEIIDRKIKIVIGPIFSASISAIEKDAKANQITVISLSNNQQLMGKVGNGGGIFLAGMMPEVQVDKIIGYSLRKGKFNFAIIAPNNQYGTTMNNLFKQVIKNRDGNLITSEFYEPNDKNIDHTVNRVINSFTISSQLKMKKDVTITDADRSYPQVLIIPESGKILSKIVASIKKQNIEERDFQIVGTSQWDDISTLNDRNLLGSWFVAPEPEKFRNFENNYYRIYNKFPPRLSSIVYDSVLAISQVIEQKKGQEPSFQDFISYSNKSKNGFDGIDGLFRFLPNGLVQRNLAVLQVSNGHFETIEKPIEKFLKY